MLIKDKDEINVRIENMVLFCKFWLEVIIKVFNGNEKGVDLIVYWS